MSLCVRMRVLYVYWSCSKRARLETCAVQKGRCENAMCQHLQSRGDAGARSAGSVVMVAIVAVGL